LIPPFLYGLIILTKNSIFLKGEKIEVVYKKGLPAYQYVPERKPDSIYTIKNITGETGINFLHRENPFSGV
jgi:hypothetical protein